MSIFENNRALLERFRQGDQDALTAVYERYVDDVSIVVKRGFIVGSRGIKVIGAPSVDVEHELIQETFVRAFSNNARRAYDGLRPYRPYLLRITKNLMVDRLRSGPVTKDLGVGDIEQLIEGQGVDRSIADPQWQPEEDLHWRRLQTATRAFVEGLDPESKTLVRLRFEEELPQDEVAQRMNCTRRRVRTLEGRVQKALRKHLQKRGF